MARALAVPASSVELDRALGETVGVSWVVGLGRARGVTVGVIRVVGGMKVKEGVKEAVVVCERSVNVASTVVECVAVEDWECAVTVAAEVTEAGAGVPVRWGLPVPPREGLSVALGQLVAVEVPEAEGRPEVLPVPEKRPEALPVPEKLPEALPEARAEEGALAVALWQSECEAEGEGRRMLGALPEGLRVCEPVAGLLGGPLEVM